MNLAEACINAHASSCKFHLKYDISISYEIEVCFNLYLRQTSSMSIRWKV
jgi:hypothetical protein